MLDYRRYRIPGGTVFFNVNLLERYPNDLLTRPIDVLRQVVKETRKRRPFYIDSWVVVTDHMHCIWT
jgi:putative transposase